MSLRDDLIAAKALIDTPEKWRKDAGIGPNGEMCPIRAIEKAVGIPTWKWPTDDRARAAIRALDPQAGRGVGPYNDEPTTTHADIMALFDRAIEAAQ